jgi:hypothetical protein
MRQGWARRLRRAGTPFRGHPSSVGYASALSGAKLALSQVGNGIVMKVKANGSYTTFLGAIGCCCVVMLAALNVSSARAQDVDYGKMNADACSNAMGVGACSGGLPSVTAPGRIIREPDPCFVAQNALRPCNSAPQAPAQPISIDPHLLGKWYMPRANGLWVFEILPNGTYRFHSEAGDGVASHTGSFSAGNRHWSMRATTGYADEGTYVLQGSDVWLTTGRQGTATWRHNR